jgi:hypothetical protein
LSRRRTQTSPIAIIEGASILPIHITLLGDTSDGYDETITFSISNVTNVANSQAGSDCSSAGAITPVGSNLESQNPCGFDLNGIDPLLDGLADNGSSVFTHALLTDGPAPAVSGSLFYGPETNMELYK